MILLRLFFITLFSPWLSETGAVSPPTSFENAIPSIDRQIKIDPKMIKDLLLPNLRVHLSLIAPII
jgi:hypothetical protein